jgi:hypothetical protein
MFNEVLALRGSNDLAPYAAAKDLIPASVEVCAGQHPGPVKPAAKPAVRTASKR